MDERSPGHSRTPTLASPPSRVAPPTGPSLPISSALFTLGTRSSYSEPWVQLLPPASCSLTRVSISCLFSLELTDTQPCQTKCTLKVCGTVMWGHQRQRDHMLELPLWMLTQATALLGCVCPHVPRDSGSFQEAFQSNLSPPCQKQ